MNQESEELEKSKQLDAPGDADEKLPEMLPAESNPEESSPAEIDTDEEDFVDPLEDDELDFPSRGSRKRIGMFCFHCNRREGHFLYRQNRWYYSYLIGLTFGLIKIVGPYQCQCCGHRRFMCADWISLRYLLRRNRDRRNSKSKKGKSSKGYS